MLLQRWFLDVVLPFEEGIYYDWWMAFVASCNGGVDYIDETLVYQRVHASNAYSSNNLTEKQQFYNHREDVKVHLKKFLTAPNIKPGDKALGELFYKRFVNINDFYDRVRLFLLIFKYRRIFFYQKRRIIGLFSHLKHSGLWAFR